MVRLRPFCESHCLSILNGLVPHEKTWTSVIDDDGNDVMRLQMRKQNKGRDKFVLAPRKEVIGITMDGQTRTLAEFDKENWYFGELYSAFKLIRGSGSDRCTFEFIGDKGPVRALLADLSGPDQRNTANAIFTSWMAYIAIVLFWSIWVPGTAGFLKTY